MVEDWWELSFRIGSVPLAVGMFASSILLVFIALGSLASGIPIVAVFVLGSILTMLISLGLFHYITTGEGAPPWAWWSRE